MPNSNEDFPNIDLINEASVVIGDFRKYEVRKEQAEFFLADLVPRVKSGGSEEKIEVIEQAILELEALEVLGLSLLTKAREFFNRADNLKGNYFYDFLSSKIIELDDSLKSLAMRIGQYKILESSLKKPNQN